MTVCSTSNTREKKRRDEVNTGCCWNKVSEFKSLESSDSVQRIEGGQGDPGRTRKTTGQPEEACGGYRRSPVHHDRFPSFLSQDWWYAFSASVLVETGLALSRLFIEIFPQSFCCRTLRNWQHMWQRRCDRLCSETQVRDSQTCAVTNSNEAPSTPLTANSRNLGLHESGTPGTWDDKKLNSIHAGTQGSPET